MSSVGGMVEAAVLDWTRGLAGVCDGGGVDETVASGSFCREAKNLPTPRPNRPQPVTLTIRTLS
jgi:hypothetical protein